MNFLLHWTLYCLDDIFMIRLWLNFFTYTMKNKAFINLFLQQFVKSLSAVKNHWTVRTCRVSHENTILSSLETEPMSRFFFLIKCRIGVGIYPFAFLIRSWPFQGHLAVWHCKPSNLNTKPRVRNVLCYMCMERGFLALQCTYISKCQEYNIQHGTWNILL